MPFQKPGNKKIDGAGYGSVLNFFKPLAQSRPHTPPQALRSSATASTPLSSPPPSSLPSHTTTPVRPATSVIPASDDDKSDGGYSDDSLEDLSTLLGRRQPPTALPPPQRPQHSPYVTPRAKRTEVHFHSSPLAFMPKHKFDFKALAKDARLDDATTASSMRAKTAADETEHKAKLSRNDAPGDAFMDIVKERSGQDAQKVLRAVQRSGSDHSQQRYCFFDPDYRCPLSTAAPRDARTGPWRLLTHGNVKLREQHLASGVLQTAIRKMNNLPDSLLEWILDELCIQKSMLMRSEYCSIVADCPEQIARLITPQRLQELFLRLGADKNLEEEGFELSLSNLDQEPYRDRDWTCLQSFLWLLGTISPHLSVSAVKSATHTLLRMSMDCFLICNLDVLVKYEDAVQCLAEAIPNCSWDSFCLELSTSLSAGIKNQNIRANALLGLPLSSARIHDLRRRLATVFLFGDTALARHNPADILAIKDFINLLDGDDYTINLDTDFAELKSRIILFDIAIDDGCVVDFDDGENEKHFNDDVDKLASKLGEIWRKINDSGMKLARTETKSVVEWVQQRLSHAVRTRRKAKKSVFDIGIQGEDPFVLRQQQDYMKKFLQPK
ncbi:hypothetical protein HRG_004551 [Hirsutella rhossiliensis]|uniref:Uncharacterized protein n=1 Tax=Hirsutella rhossiliensis TaxID=111463 RepID=A0A9P8MXY7_9HYPO|nr:uncharacterized protein HRG_04551 [Hirsutella rhossiliensis]KAH0964123.1 hypothetical protein HRG_04551 [Hirsutella rhossiliensis]